MTDRELIDLIERAAPDELSAEQMGLLRRRMRHSPALQDALCGRLRLDQYLNDSLGGVQVSVEAVLATAAAAPFWLRPFGGRLGWWGLGGLIVAILGTLTTVPLLRDALAPRAAEQEALAPPAGMAIEAPPAERPPLPAAPAMLPAAAEAPERVAARPTIAPTGDTASTTAPIAAEDAASPDDEGPVDDESSPSDVGGLRIEVEAEGFVRGNVEIDTTVFGQGIGVVRSAAQPSFVEFEVPVAEAGDYDLEVRYAADESRPFRASVNDQRVEFEAPSTGNCYPDAQHWFTLGSFALPQGRTLIRLEADGEFPHLDKLALVASEPRVAAVAPWTDAVSGTARQVPFEQACFEDFDPARPGPAPGELEQWLSPQPGEARTVAYRDGLAPEVQGLSRLAAPWPKDAALRLALYDHHGFQLHFWYGRGGVTLRYYQGLRPGWAAYRTTRVSAGPRPVGLSLVATDDDRYRRTGLGTIEIRHHAGVLVVTRGDVRLLTAPLEGPPEEVYFDGRAGVRGIAMVRSSPPPPEDLVRPVVLRSLKPASMAWHSRFPQGAALGRREDGSLVLTSSQSSEVATTALPIGPPGLYEVLLEVEDPAPGTGVFLGDGGGRLSHRLGFFRDAASGRTVFGWLPPDETRTEVQLDPADVPAPYSAGRQWLRLVVGCGTLRCWASGDGRHWSEAVGPLVRDEGMPAYTHVGLYALPGGERSIALRSVEVRELSALTSLAGVSLRAAAAALIHESALREPGLDRAAWLQGVLERQPPGVDADAWRRACAIQTIAAGAPRALANDLLLALVEEGWRMDAPPPPRLALFHEAAQLLDTGEDGPAAARAARLLALLDDGEKRTTAADRWAEQAMLARAAIWLPVRCGAGVEVLPLSAARRSVLEAFFAGDSTGLARFARRQEFWSRGTDPALAAPPERAALVALAGWAAAASTAGEQEIAMATDDDAERTINAMRQAAAAGDWQAACQAWVGSAVDAHALVADPADPRRTMTATAVLDGLFAEHPEFARAMAEEHAAAAIAAVRQALATEDAAAIEASAARYAGTQAAALARAWLGDRALAAGRFAAAEREYRAAERWASDSLRPDIQARLRLIAAIDGRQQGMPPMGAVMFGGRELSAQEFERVVAELVALRRAADHLDGPAGRASGVPPALYSAAPVCSLPPVTGCASLPSVALAAGRLYAADGASVAAFDMAGGTMLWSVAPATGASEPVEGSLCPDAPLVIGERLIVRWATDCGGQLACVDAVDGAVLWTTPPDVNVLAGPLLVDDSLLAVALARGETGGNVGTFVIDAASGIVARHALFAAPAGAAPSCRATASDDRLVALCGDAVFCCDARGRPLWVRRQGRVPQSLEDVAASPRDARPYVADGAVYVAPGDVHGVECLDLETGALRWRSPLADAAGVVGLSEGRLVVALPNGLAALDALTGSPIWTHRDPDLLAAAGAAEGLAAYVRRESLPGSVVSGRIVWLGLADGVPRFSSPLVGQPLAGWGPIVVSGEEYLACALSVDGGRTLVRLSPRGAALPSGGGGPLDAWTMHADPAWRGAVEGALPDWTLLASDGGGADAAEEGAGGLTTVAASAKRPARLARRLNAPSGYRLRLVVNVDAAGSGAWRLTIAVAGRTLVDRTIDPAAGSPTVLDVDLSDASSDGWLTVTQQPLDGPAAARWRRLEIVAAPQ